MQTKQVLTRYNITPKQTTIKIQNNMKEKTIYESPQIEVVDAYPEKAYCSGGNNYSSGGEAMETEEGYF